MSSSNRDLDEIYHSAIKYVSDKATAMGFHNFWDKFGFNQGTGNPLYLSKLISKKDAKLILNRFQLGFGRNAQALDIVESSVSGYIRIALDLTKLVVPASKKEQKIIAPTLTQEKKQKEPLDLNLGKEYVNDLTRNHFSKSCPLRWEEASATELKSNAMSKEEARHFLYAIQEIAGPNKDAFGMYKATLPDSQGNPLFRIVMDVNLLKEDQLEIKIDPNKPNLVRIANFLNDVHSHDIEYGESSIFPVRWSLPTDAPGNHRFYFDSGAIICKGVVDIYIALGQATPRTSDIKEAVLENFSDAAKAAGFDAELIKKMKAELGKAQTTGGGYHGKTGTFVIQDPDLIKQLDKLADRYYNRDKNPEYRKGAAKGVFFDKTVPAVAEKVIGKFVDTPVAVSLAHTRKQAAEDAKKGHEKDMEQKKSLKKKG